jgi:NADPH:quinone reductase-like Zn-dependent oxidoreductase
MAEKMLAVTAPTFTDPSGYELTNVERPTVTEKSDVVIQVHAASINPVDVKKAAGVFKMALQEE